MITISLFTVFTVAVIVSAPVTAETSSQSCQDIVQRAGVSANYAQNVAHGLHDLTLDDLKKFNPSVTVDNHIPSYNMDLSSKQQILPNVLDMKAPDDRMFVSDAMKTVDAVLSKMDDKNWDLKLSPLERLVHRFHMNEIWAKSLKNYQELKKMPLDEAACACLTDYEKTGIRKQLPQFYFLYDDRHYIMMPEKLIRQAPLVDEHAWQQWKNLMKQFDPNRPKDLAVFLHCALDVAKPGLITIV